MLMITQGCRIASALSVLLLVSACSQSSAPELPTLPSAAPGSSISVPTAPASGESIAGRSANRGVELRGPITRITGNCPEVTFVVQDTTVVTDSSTEFRRSCDELAVRTWVHVKGVRQGDETVLALHVVVAGHERSDKVELGGIVQDVRGTCPGISFSVRDRDVAVLANDATQYRAGSCRDVQPGARVHVKGTRHDDGKVLAEMIVVTSQGLRP
jgi:hypothetical protein